MGEDTGEFASIKDNYIKRIRRPFEVVYLVSILILLAVIILSPEISVLTLALVLCISAHMVELVYEKHTQNRLMSTSLAAIPKTYLTPSLIHWELTRHSPRTHTVITTY
jgi:hypothetical protein